MNTVIHQTEQKSHTTVSMLMTVALMLILTLVLNTNALHGIQISIPFEKSGIQVISDSGSPIAVPVATPPITQPLSVTTPTATSGSSLIQVPQPISAPVPLVP